jgi:hypothetical protein
MDLLRSGGHPLGKGMDNDETPRDSAFFTDSYFIIIFIYVCCTWIVHGLFMG